MADQHSKILDACSPLSPIFFIFMQFSVNFGQILGWRPPFRYDTPFGNPGSTAENGFCFAPFPSKIDFNFGVKRNALNERSLNREVTIYFI